MSHIQQQRNLFAKNKAIIKNILGWEHESPSYFPYEALQHKMGLQYLYDNMYEFEAQCLERDDLFWKWWINQWNLRDAVLVPQLPQKPNYSCRDYEAYHSIDCISNFPSPEIMEQAYDNFITTYNEKHVSNK